MDEDSFSFFDPENTPYYLTDRSESSDGGISAGTLMGPNGAGKSTIIKSIAGLLRYQGQIGIQEIPARQLEAKRIFGYVPEIPAMFEALTVREHIEYIRKAYGEKGRAHGSITDEA